MVAETFYWIIGVMTVIAAVGLARGLWAMVKGTKED